MKKLLFCVLFAFILSSCIFLVCKVFFAHKHDMAHIYLDTTSFPTLLQAVDFVKIDEKAPKFVFWERLLSLDSTKDIFHNTMVVKQRENLGESLKQFIEKHNDAQFVIHINKDDNELVWQALRAVPAKQIKEIHFYEGNFALTAYQDVSWNTDKNFVLNVLSTESYTDLNKIHLAYSVMPYYPSILHIAIEKFAKENSKIADALGGAKQIEEIDLEGVSRSLSETQKDKLLKLFDVKDEYIQLFNSANPTVLYTLGFFPDGDHSNKLQINVLKNALDKEPFHSKDIFNFNFLYKEHPKVSSNSFVQVEMAQKYPFVYRLPKEIPLEVLFLVGYTPYKVFGYSSSLFFSVPKENILFYIKRDNDMYLPLLKKMGKITDEQVFSLTDFEKI